MLYFLWSRIRINTCLCNFDDVYLRTKIVFILFGLIFICNRSLCMVDKFYLRKRKCVYFGWSRIRM